MHISSIFFSSKTFLINVFPSLSVSKNGISIKGFNSSIFKLEYCAESKQHTDEISTNMTLAKFLMILSSKLLYFKLPQKGLLLIVYAFSFGKIRSCSISCFIRRSPDEKVDRNSSVSKHVGKRESVCVCQSLFL